VAVKVRAAPPPVPIKKVHGEVVVAQVVVLLRDPKFEPLQPANTEPGLAVTVIVPVALLLTLREQGLGLPVQLKLSAALGALTLTAIVPVPEPANVILRLLSSLNAVCATKRED